MLKIRLKKLGRKKKPFYRIIVVDSRKKRDGKAITEIGFYNPMNKQYQIHLEKLQEYVAYGAKLTKTVQNLVDKNYKINNN